MPEVITKYPESLLRTLKNAGMKCGTGEKQQILTTCPKDNFCTIPTGEICVYDIKNIREMTQINTLDLHEAIGNTPPALFSWPSIFLITIVFILGIVLGKVVL